MSSKRRSSEHTHPAILTLGLTGLIGSGKSYVARLLAERDIPVYDSDRRAKELYDEDPALRKAMVESFGEGIYDTTTGRLDRQRLAGIIFADREKLATVNALVHPAVRRDFASWRIQQAEQGTRACLIESALLLQASLVSYVDAVIVVTASEALRLERASQRDGVSKEAIRERMRHQLPEDELTRQADFVIVNEPTQALAPQLDALLARVPGLLPEPSAQ